MRPAPAALLAAALIVLCAAPAARAAERPSVGAELHRLTLAGRLDPATAAGYRAGYVRAGRTLKTLRGVRAVQLRAVLGNVRSAARGGLMAPSRLPALFQTLERNRAWWASAPIPPAGHRIRFAGSQIVWQYYPGQGLQIQWLGTFGKANALWVARDRDPELRALLDEALGLATQRAGGLAFEYLFAFNGGRPPWVSGLAQGTALSALTRAAVRLGDPAYFAAARSTLGIFRTAPPRGVRIATPVGAHYLQYSFAPELRIVNGFTQALNGLRDFAVLANDPEGRALFSAGEAQLRSELPSFDTGAWSLYSRTAGAGLESDLGYHRLLRDFLLGLCERLTDDRQRAAAQPPAAGAPDPATGGTPAATSVAPVADPALYCDMAQRFTADLTTPPEVEVAPATLRARRTGTLRFTVSKVSTVTVTVARGARVVLSRTARLGHGARTIRLRPARSGPLAVRIRAIDLAGNVGSTAGAITVRPAKKRPRSDG